MRSSASAIRSSTPNPASEEPARAGEGDRGPEIPAKFAETSAVPVSEAVTSKSIVAAGAMLLLSCSGATAQGVNLSWNDCGTNGAASMTYGCASNAGAPFAMIASFVPPHGVNAFLGLASQIDITTPTAVLPDWWKHGASECRGAAGLAAAFDFTTGFSNCYDFWQGQAGGGLAYDVGFGAPNRARLRV